jgi:hypothetical protein
VRADEKLTAFVELESATGVRKAIKAADLYPEKGPRNAELYKSSHILRAIATGRD